MAEPKPIRPIAVVGAFPPPVNGYAVITSSLETLLRGYRTAIRFDISPGTAKRGPAYHLRRVSRVAGTCMRLVLLRVRVGRFDTYIATESRAGLLYTIAIATLARVLGCDLYLHHHVFRYIDRRSRLMAALVSLTRSSATHILLCSCMRKSFNALYSASSRSVVVSNLAFLGEPVEPPSTGPERSVLTAGLLSNLTREKGLYKFLDLAEASVRSGLPVRFILAGPANRKTDADAIARAVTTIGPALSYLGPIFNEDKDRFYRDLDVFLFPTTYANEAQPMVLYEALSRGCKVIAFDRGCIAEQVAGSGWIIPRTAEFVPAALAHLRDLARHRDATTTGKQDIVRSVKTEYWLAKNALASLLISR